MQWSDIALTLTELLSPIAAVALTWLSVQLATLIRARVHAGYLRDTLLRADVAIFTATKELQQTVVDAIKEARADGKLTPEEKEGIRRQALTKVKAYLGPEGLELLARVLGLKGGVEVDRLLTAKLEAAVHDLRRLEASSPSQKAPHQVEDVAGPFAAAPAS